MYGKLYLIFHYDEISDKISNIMYKKNIFII